MKNKLTGLKTILLSMIVMALWGSLFPCIKIGYKAFAINGNDIPNILMFAGSRFTICGAVICLMALLGKDKTKAPTKKSLFIILINGFS